MKAVAVELGFKEERPPSLPFTLLHLLEEREERVLNNFPSILIFIFMIYHLLEEREERVLNIYHSSLIFIFMSGLLQL